MLEDFNPNGGGMIPPLPEIGEENVEDDLDLAIAEAPEGSARDRYRYARERIFPLLLCLEDQAERGATLQDIASTLKLSIKDLRRALAQEEAAAAAREAEEREEETPQAEIDQEEIDALVGKPGVLKRIVEAAATYSKVVGERYLLGLLFLVFASAQLELLPNGKPLGANCILSASPGRGKNYLADAVARLLPEEFYFAFESSSPQSLFYKAKVEGPGCLKHRVLYPNEAEAVDPLIVTFRPVLSGGKAKRVTVGKDGGEKNVGQEIELEGPMTLVVPTVRNKSDKQLQSRMLLADINDYPGRVAAHSRAVSEQLSPITLGQTTRKRSSPGRQL